MSPTLNRNLDSIKNGADAPVSINPDKV